MYNRKSLQEFVKNFATKLRYIRDFGISLFVLNEFYCAFKTKHFFFIFVEVKSEHLHMKSDQYIFFGRNMNKFNIALNLMIHVFLVGFFPRFKHT